MFGEYLKSIGGTWKHLVGEILSVVAAVVEVHRIAKWSAAEMERMGEVQTGSWDSWSGSAQTEQQPASGARGSAPP